MHMNTIDAAQLAELLIEAPPLMTTDHDGQLIHVIEYGGGDLLAIVNPLTGGAVCIYPPDSFEGGTVHDNVRAMLGADA